MGRGAAGASRARTGPRPRAGGIQASHRTLVALARRAGGKGERSLCRARGRRSSRPVHVPPPPHGRRRGARARRRRARAIPGVEGSAARPRSEVTRAAISTVSDTFRACRAPTVNPMERQAGLGRSLEDVLDSLTPVDSTDQAPAHALFGIAPEDAPVAPDAHATEKKKTKKFKGKNKKSQTNTKTKTSKNTKSKKKKKKSKGKQRSD